MLVAERTHALKRSDRADLALALVEAGLSQREAHRVDRGEPRTIGNTREHGDSSRQKPGIIYWESESG